MDRAWRSGFRRPCDGFMEVRYQAVESTLKLLHEPEFDKTFPRLPTHFLRTVHISGRRGGEGQGQEGKGRVGQGGEEIFQGKDSH